MEKASDGIWIIDGEARTTYVNERMAEILAVSPVEMLGQNSLDYIFPEDAGRAQGLFAAKKAGHTDPFRFRLRRKDGSAIWVHVQGTPMYNAAGTFIGVVGTFTAV